MQTRTLVVASQVREINKYTLQEKDTAGGVPRTGLYILQDERCWELIPPEEVKARFCAIYCQPPEAFPSEATCIIFSQELDHWVSSLQLAVFGEEVGCGCYCTHFVTTEVLLTTGHFFWTHHA